MKRVWVCQWEIARGDGLHAKEYDSFLDAVQAMRQKISECIDLEEYIADLEPVAANYLRNYLSDPEFPRSEEDVPDDWDLPDYGDLALYSGWIRWKYPFDAYPVLNTNLVMNPDGDEKCFFDFHYNYPEEATGHGVKGLNICIIPCMNFGTSAYPLMVWLMLRDTPQTQSQLAKRILNVLGTAIDRKAISRHLKLLQALGFPVQHSPEGYYISGESHEPELGIKYGPSAYPLLILQVLDRTPQSKATIIRAVQKKYGAKIDRKAIGRHLELLDALGYNIQKRDDGYYFGE